MEEVVKRRLHLKAAYLVTCALLSFCNQLFHNSLCCSQPKTGQNPGETRFSTRDFIHKFGARPPMEHTELSMPPFETPPASPTLGTERRTTLRRAWRRSVNIHMVVHVVMWAEKYLWPLHLSVQFAVQLAGIVPTPAPPNEDRLFFFLFLRRHPLFHAQRFLSPVPGSAN